jgi:hypothetical protein
MQDKKIALATAGKHERWRRRSQRDAQRRQFDTAQLKSRALTIVV